MTKAAREVRNKLNLPDTPGEPVKPLGMTGQCGAGGKRVCNAALVSRDPRLCNYDAVDTVMGAIGTGGRF